MPEIQDRTTISLRIKRQAGLGSPASGSGAQEIEVLASPGMAASAASIESGMIRKSAMRKRPRLGTNSATAAYETEASARGALDQVLEDVLGGAFENAFDIDNTDVTSVTITGTGVTLTTGSGDLIDLGVRAGMMGKFTNLATAGNNGKWFPILSVTATVLTIPSGYLVDETIDSAFTLTIARFLITTTPYTNRYLTLEEYRPDNDVTTKGTDMRPSGLTINIEPRSYVRIGWSYGGTTIDAVDSVDAPVFTDPTLKPGESLILLDGGVFVNGVKRLDLSGLSFSLQAPITGVDLIGTRVGKAFRGMFVLSGNLQGVDTGNGNLSAFTDEDDISILLHMKEKETENFLSMYFGQMLYGGFGGSAGGEGAGVQSLPLYGGEDERGDDVGYAPTSILVSTSAAA